MILTPSDTTGTNKQFSGTEGPLINSRYFLRTVMEGSEDMILTPSNTTGTDKQFGGTEGLILLQFLIVFDLSKYFF